MVDVVVDVNVVRMEEYNRIQLLTKAVDSLIAREFAIGQKNEMLTDLETAIEETEKLLETLEQESADIRTRCALLRPSGNACRVGEDGEVARIWQRHGASMREQLNRHVKRLAALYTALDEGQEGTDATHTLV